MIILCIKIISVVLDLTISYSYSKLSYSLVGTEINL